MNLEKESPETLQHKVPPFDFRWLNGEEYEEMLINQDLYVKDYSFPIVDKHPEEIYYSPKNGFVYYLKQNSLRSLGFPRLKDNSRKLFKWKKMNFQTPLPKHDPRVCYIVCSTTSSDSVHFRMHVVQLYKHRDQEGILLCHLLQIQTKWPVTRVYKPKWEVEQGESEELDEIRKTKSRLSKLVDEADKVRFQVDLFRFTSMIEDDDVRYIKERLYGGVRNSFLEDELEQKYQAYMSVLSECKEVLQYYESL